MALDVFFFPQFIAPGLKPRKANFIAAHRATVNPQDCPRQTFEKPPVVADQNKRRAGAAQLFFKP